MSKYVSISDAAMKHYQKETICDQLREAQAEIERLNRKAKLCTPAEHERLIEQRVIKDLGDRMETAERVISTTTADCSRRLRLLEAPPKDLSDPYPRVGPRVVEQKRWDVLSEWLMKVDKRLRQVEGGDPTSTVPRWKNVCLGLSERLDMLEEPAKEEELCLSSGDIQVTVDNLHVERRKNQRRCRPTPKRTGRRTVIRDRRQA